MVFSEGRTGGGGGGGASKSSDRVDDDDEEVRFRVVGEVDEDAMVGCVLCIIPEKI